MSHPNADRVLIVIPARAGSKRVPRKNVRPLGGKPLILHAIEAARAVPNATVVVTSDDDEVNQLARRAGALAYNRSPELCGDEIPLDPVIIDAVKRYERECDEKVGIVVSLQPTCPFIRPRHISAAVSKLEADSTLDTVLSVAEDRHLRWSLRNGEMAPLYAVRVNSQMLPMEYRETGGVIACSRRQLELGTRIGSHTMPLILSGAATIDIDTFDDFRHAAALVDVKRIVFVVTGNERTGLGHVYRALTLATELVVHDLEFVCAESDDLAIRHISEHNYRVITCPESHRARTALSLKPDLVISDVLDTSCEYMDELKKSGAKLLNFEDMGSGSHLADAVVNALYEMPRSPGNYHCGIEYFCLRREFQGLHPRATTSEVARIIIAFGGVDEGDLTARTVRLTAGLFARHNIVADIVVGPGYQHLRELQSLLKIGADKVFILHENCRTISDLMLGADFAITSAGRTALELMSLGVPSIVICQNARECAHTFAREENGMINLGRREEVADAALLETVEELIASRPLRARLSEAAIFKNISHGIHEVINMIEGLLSKPNGARNDA